jgi:acyl-CoA synthetase (AMP-forming)/AMP-acid ligase II
MRGTMQDWPLRLSTLLDNAARWHGGVEMVSRLGEGPLHRTTYSEIERRARRLAGALRRLGVEPGERVATMAWNSYRHVELFFAIPGAGAICHTLNPRLAGVDMAYILNHAGDRTIFVDADLVPRLEAIAAQLTTLKRLVVLTDGAPPATAFPETLAYEALIDVEPEPAAWAEPEETDAAALCYTSGTTGRPKGVLYSHRGLVLHAFSQCQADNMGLSSRSVMLPAAGMFHANSWGIPHAAAMCGAKLVMPGRRLDGASLFDLLEREAVDYAAGVPTVWRGFLDHLDESGQKPTHLKRLFVGGSAMARATMRRFEEEFGVSIQHGWGMTEIGPVASSSLIKHKHAGLALEQRLDWKSTQGRVHYAVEMRVVDDHGVELARDGKSPGHVQVRGPWVTERYFPGEGEPVTDPKGWFDTGDVGSLDADGYLRMTDRAKDLIKSGGEWISSIDLENAALQHAGVAEAAAIGLPHPKWDERPLLVVVKAPGAEVEPEAILDCLRPHFAKWQLPDEIVFASDLPHTATGKVSKLQLRERFKDHTWASLSQTERKSGNN